MAPLAQGWVFLVARGRYTGYRTVLAPGFLIDENLHHVLADGTSTAGMDATGTRVAELTADRAGPISIGYTSVELACGDIDEAGAQSAGSLTDEHGRPLQIIYGVVSRKRLQEPLDEEDLRVAREQALQSYRRFLAQEQDHRVEASDAFALRTATRGVIPRPRRPFARRVGALAVAGVALIVIAFLMQSGTGADVVAVRGVIGSEKQSFFRDRAVVKAFEKHGLRVSVDTAGSREIATTTDLSRYDFAFPAGAHAVAPIQRKLGTQREYRPFRTPLAIASFSELAELLRRAHIAKPIGGVYWTFDMKAYLELVKRNTRWRDLRGNTQGEVLDGNGLVLVSSTNLLKSNSAALYLAIASYVANGKNIVAGQAAAKRIAGRVAPLFKRQGATPDSTDDAFETYLASGFSDEPLVMIYEAQFLARLASGDGSITSDMVLMYPRPTVVSTHTLVPRTAAGDRVGRLLTDDPELQRLAARYGFRPGSNGALETYLRSKRVNVPPELRDVINPPTYETLETMITTIAPQLVGKAGDPRGPG